MKESVTIRKSNVERLGKELLKEVDNFLHDEYIITTFPEMKLDQEKFENSMNKYKSKSLDLQEMYDIFVNINLDDEIDGDLFFKKRSYEDLFRVLFTDYMYLED